MARVSNIVALKVSDIMFHHTIIGNSQCEYMVLSFDGFPSRPFSSLLLAVLPRETVFLTLRLLLLDIGSPMESIWSSVKSGASKVATVTVKATTDSADFTKRKSKKLILQKRIKDYKHAIKVRIKQFGVEAYDRIESGDIGGAHVSFADAQKEKKAIDAKMSWAEAMIARLDAGEDVDISDKAMESKSSEVHVTVSTSPELPATVQPDNPGHERMPSTLYHSESAVSMVPTESPGTPMEQPPNMPEGGYAKPPRPKRNSDVNL
eukprot:g75850.t1